MKDDPENTLGYIVRVMWNAFKKSTRNDPAKREMRHATYRQAIRVHHENRQTYNDVMRGW